MTMNIKKRGRHPNDTSHICVSAVSDSILEVARLVYFPV